MKQTVKSRSRFSAQTPISIEREFSLYHLDASPAKRSTTRDYIEQLNTSLSNNRFKVVEEVAGSAFEIKICFSSIQEIATDLKIAYSAALTQAKKMDLMVIGISPPQLPDEYNEFFTTKAFPNIKQFLGKSNSIHIHVGGYSQEELLLRYNVGNMLAPLLLDISQSSIIDGFERGRAVNLYNFINGIPSILSTPWVIRSFEEYNIMLENAKSIVEDYLKKTGNGNLEIICRDYPSFAKKNGRGFEILKLTPDKIFHFARLRPDMPVLEKGLLGTVELRSIDGQSTIGKDLGFIELALGNLAYLERYPNCLLNLQNIQQLMLAVKNTTKTPSLSRIMQFRKVFNNADSGFKTLGILPQKLHEIKKVLSSPSYLEFSNLSPEKIVYEAARQLQESVE